MLLDLLWILIAASMVIAMQAGFLCLESGLSRSKNTINVAIKNLADFGLAVLLFWGFGFGLMFGLSQAGWFGTTGYLFGDSASPRDYAFFLFQVSFCGTAATIVSGAVAERIRFVAYLAITAVISGLIYPVFGHWAWGGLVEGTGQGWLSRIGFIDFAGSTVVHSIGGWFAFAAIALLGARTGRFGDEQRAINGNNLPLAMLGVLILLVGWFGFNGGSVLAMDETVPRILVNTMMAAAAGGAGALLLSLVFDRYPNVLQIMNGVIAGLVSVTASCHLAAPVGAVAVGLGGACVCRLGTHLLNRWQFDDVIGAWPAHGLAGAWGTLAVAFVCAPEAFGTGLSRWSQFLVQSIGVGVAFGWAFGIGGGVLWVINRFVPLRVSPEDEQRGLNVAEHGVSTELVDFLTELERQSLTGNFSHRVTVEPHTEVGQIASSYNRVLDRVEEEQTKLRAAGEERELLNKQLVEAALHAGKAEVATEVLHNVGNALNSVNVGMSVASESIAAAPIDLLEKTIALVRSHESNLGEFITKDPRGRMIPGYLSQLCEVFREHQSQSRSELAKAIEHLDHIKAVISSQQDYAGNREVEEPLFLSRLLEDAEALNGRAFERHGIEVRREYDDLPEVLVQRQKLLQIVVNLLRNAKDAMNGAPVKILTLTLRQEGEQAVIAVQDTGMGVAPQNRDQIFRHGFTTKRTGHGFGLHSCANTIREMGGSLDFESDGIGCGTTFTVKLPLKLAVEHSCRAI